MQAALWCSFGHRILEGECMGMECPFCKVRKADEVAMMMSMNKGAVQ